MEEGDVEIEGEENRAKRLSGPKRRRAGPSGLKT